MELKIGQIMMEYEHERLASIVDSKRELKHVMSIIPKLLKIIQDGGVEIEDYHIGWCSSVTIKGKLPEHVYKALAEATDSYPELTVSEQSNFDFRLEDDKNGTLWSMVYLGKGACKVKKIVTITEEMKPVETVKYELVGDCSGLEA